jgi:signal transduction histidine kinase
MEGAARTRWGRWLAGASVATAVIGVGIILILGSPWWLVDTYIAHNAVLAIGFGALAWVSFPTQPRNREVWTLAWAAAFGALFVAGPASLTLLANDRFGSLAAEQLLALTPAELSLTEAIALQPTAWAWIPAFFLVLTLGLLWFPDGRPPSPRWRWMARFSVLVIGANVLFWMWVARPGSTTPIEGPTRGPLEDIESALLLLAVVSAVISVAALVSRYRYSAGDVRHQIRWIAWGGAMLLTALFTIMVFEGTRFGTPAAYLGLAAEIVLIGSFAVSISRYRLYDIDAVISRTVTYGVLAVFITGVYAAVVVGIGTLAGRGDETNLGLAIAATAVVALLFEPIRSRVQRWANRLVFGERATPYAVLSELTARLSETDTNEQALERLAELVASGTGAKEAIVWLRVGDHFRPEATVSTGELDPVNGDAHPFMVGETLVTEPTSVQGDAAEAIYHGGELLGVLAIRKGTKDPVTRADHDLLRDVAAGSGPLLRNIRLNAELAERADELRISRRRLVAAQDLERRRLERNLHDGAQQQVVAIKVKLGLAKTLAEREEVDQIAEAVGDLADDTQRAVDGMRVAARGIYPPLLEAEGLRAALVAVARDASIGIDIDAGDIGRYAPEIEATVYFSVLAAVAHRAGAPTNGAKVTVRDDGEGLSFEVRGFSVSPGPELTAVADRLDALGGTLGIDTEDGGTIVTGYLPATALEPA